MGGRPMIYSHAFLNGRDPLGGFMSAACTYTYYIYPPLRRTLKALDHGENATKYGRSIKEGAHPRIVTSRRAGNSRNCPVHSHSAESNVRRTRERGMATYMFEPSIHSCRALVFVLPFGDAPGANAECVVQKWFASLEPPVSTIKETSRGQRGWITRWPGTAEQSPVKRTVPSDYPILNATKTRPRRHQRSRHDGVENTIKPRRCS